MSRTRAPSMPTEHQVTEAHKAVTALHPDARIKSVGPEGVVFGYPDQSTPNSEWHGKSFSAETE